MSSGLNNKRKILLNNEKIKNIFIDSNTTLLETMKQMDIRRHKLLIMTNNDKYCGLISIGDIQRSIINGTPLKTPLCNTKISKKIVGKNSDSKTSIINKMKEIRCEFMPILDGAEELVNIIFWNDLVENKQRITEIQNNLPVVVMAGGKGTRLKPISNMLPKPLTPIGDNTILEEIMDRFEQAGSKKFYLSVNYKKEMIEYYLHTKGRSDFVEYFYEDKPLGTAGSLSLLKGKITDTFYVTNCDILIDQDLNELYKYHKENDNEITLVAAMKHLSIPYGTIQSGKGGLLESMEEKPELTFKINAGVYILEPHVLEEIPDNTFIHITDLIEGVRSRGGRVGVFPISEHSWSDIGEWPEYIKTVKKLSLEQNFLGL